MKRLIIALLILAVAAAVYWRYDQNKATQERARGIPSVVAQLPVSIEMADKFEALGTLLANNNIEVTANTTEKVVAVSFVDGQSVQKGDVLVELQSAEQFAQLQAARVNLAEQEREYRRIEDLVRKRTVASSELDRLQSSIDTAKARIDEAQANLNDRIIRAPFSGQLGFRQISNGALITPGTVITTLDDISVLKLDFQIPEHFLSTIQAGTEISAISDAYLGREFKGTVTTLSSRIDPVTRSLSVRARLENTDGLLRPGMLMKVEVIRARKSVLAIPEQAIVMLQNKQFVFVVDADGNALQKDVSTGMRQNGLVEVIQGLEASDSVITEGRLKVRNGGKVTLQEETWRGVTP
ncbi:efflux RND transporter periplasmic adaptor subunit [Echinimonas agarilytica]|uniref:Efflux RND transporter periplasmic adaptor subunit n=1 Tax=Echinimonas agarilytica TaxID=1215918 RepID=A0AA41W9D2_9GAMM|nr:efflux RND transporter periplasmic adaptor subunit [Echinimonas agarilytica]MCM2681032.1 efflux RND transporter periplasmic adaptor subunit [Echinimonas agarilytica]